MTTIFWAGDSTVKEGDAALRPQTGIGEAFAHFIRPDVRIENCAENHCSTKSYIEAGRLAAIAERIVPGDFLFVQFGHNDEKHVDPARYTDPDTTFRENLARFADVARQRGATPVFITPAARYHQGNASDVYRHVRWQAAMQAEGSRLGVAVIDLTALSEALVLGMGPAAATTLYMNLPGGVSPCFPRGQRDNTHFQPAGAHAFAGLIAGELRRLGGVYAGLAKEVPETYPDEMKIPKYTLK